MKAFFKIIEIFGSVSAKKLKKIAFCTRENLFFIFYYSPNFTFNQNCVNTHGEYLSYEGKSM